MRTIRAFEFEPTLDPVTVHIAGDLTGSASVVNGRVLVYYLHDNNRPHPSLRNFVAVWAGKPLPDACQVIAMVDLGQGQIIHIVEVL